MSCGLPCVPGLSQTKRASVAVPALAVQDTDVVLVSVRYQTDAMLRWRGFVWLEV